MNRFYFFFLIDNVGVYRRAPANASERFGLLPGLFFFRLCTACCNCVVVRSPVFWRWSGHVLLLTAGPWPRTAVNVGPLSAPPSAAAPGAGRGASRVFPSGVPTAAARTGGPLASAPVLPLVFSICDRNRCCVDVSLPGGFPAAPGVEISVCSSPPSRPSVSARAGFCAAVRVCPRAIVQFSSSTIFTATRVVNDILYLACACACACAA